jgi:hypothetical protein
MVALWSDLRGNCISRSGQKRREGGITVNKKCMPMDSEMGTSFASLTIRTPYDTMRKDIERRKNGKSRKEMAPH